MRKLRLFSAVLSLFLLVPASIIWAQTISTQKGLTTIVFNVQAGTIKVYFPDDIRPGDLISGSVIAEPAGNSSRQIERNLADLQKYSLGIDGSKFIISQNEKAFKWLVPEDRQLLSPVELLSPGGDKAGQAELFLNKSITLIQAIECSVPTHALTAAPFRITGSFDGDLANTQCSLGSVPMQVLAESPRQCQVMYPQSGQGMQNLHISEGGNEKCTRSLSGVDMQVTSGSLSLRKNQNSFIDIAITGLAELPATAVLTMNNLSPAVVNMYPANDVVMPLYPEAVSSGQFFYRLSLTAIQTGGFDVAFHLDLPDPPIQLKPEGGSGSDQKKDTIPCPEEDRLTKEQQVLDALDAELAGIDVAIARAKKDTNECKINYREKRVTATQANEKFKSQEQRKKNWERQGGGVPAAVQKDYTDAKAQKEKADKEAADEKVKCEEAEKKLKDLENRKSLLPDLIRSQGALVDVVKTGLEKCKKDAEDKKRKEEEEKKKAADAIASAEAAAAVAAEARRSAVAHQRYLLQNVYSLGLINAKEFWDIKGLWDWLPEKLSKPIGDFAEDKGNPSPIPVDIIPALAGIYQVVGQLLDPCTAEGSVKTISRLKKMVNTKTDSKYTDEEALKKTDDMCETLKKIKTMSKAAGGK